MATILLVEDGPIVSREIPGLLEEAGHRVMRCGGGPTPLGSVRARCCALAGARFPTPPISSRSPARWLCSYPAAPTVVSTCCAPTAPTPSTGGSRFFSWPSRLHGIWGDQG